MDRKTKNPHIDHDLPIREDIRLLGRILGDTLYEQEGPAAFDLVEQRNLNTHPVWSFA